MVGGSGVSVGRTVGWNCVLLGITVGITASVAEEHTGRRIMEIKTHMVRIQDLWNIFPLFILTIILIMLAVFIKAII